MLHRVKLKAIRILIVDHDIRLAGIVKVALGKMGLPNTHIARTTNEASEVMQHDTVDLLITDWDMHALNGIDLCRQIRNNLQSDTCAIPIIMLTGRGEFQDVESARDSGINEYLRKPFSARSLYERILRVMDDNPAFVISKSYIGPDRRRKKADAVDSERRSPSPAPTRFRNSSDIRNIVGTQEPRLLLLPNPIRQKLGFSGNVASLITPEMVKAAQESIDSTRDEFLTWVKEDLVEMEQAWKACAADSSDTATANTLRDISLLLKTRAGTFGYNLASDVAGLLHRFCAERFDASKNQHLKIIEKHLQALTVIFAQKLSGASGTMGKQLLQELNALTHTTKG